MSDTNASPVPTVHPPAALINHTDRRGLIILIAALGLSFILACFAIRAYVRVKISGPWRGDDYLITAATIFAICQSGVVFLSTTKGYGKKIDLLSHEDLAEIGRTSFTSDILYIFAMCFSKCSTSFLFLRLSPRRAHTIVSWATVACSAVWALVAILMISIRCNPTGPWSPDLNLKCSGLFTRWAVIAALDIAIELALFGLSVYIVAELQMHWKLKFTVVLVFGLRLPVIPFAAIRLAVLHSQIPSPNPTFTAAIVSVWTQLEQDYSIMACTLPCLGPFIRPFATTHGTTQPQYAGKAVMSNSSGVINLNSLRSQSSQLDSEGGKRPDIHTRGESDMSGYGVGFGNGGLRPEKVSHKASASHDKIGAKERERGRGKGGRTDQISINSNDSKQMIIKKKMAWSVERGELR